MLVVGAELLIQAGHPVQEAWVAVATLEPLQAEMERQAQQIRAVAEVALVLVMAVQEAQAVQALSFFATPAQFNISLVAQFPLTAGM